LDQFQEKCVAVFRPELRKIKELEQASDSSEPLNCSRNIAMKTMLLTALALSIAAPAMVSAAEADVVIWPHHRHHHHHGAVVVINDEGHRLHHRRHGTVAFYDHGRRAWHHRPVVIEGGSDY
jgi:hypothetical protein